MTREQLWDAYVARNPSFAGDSRISLTPAGLRKLFDQTWDMATARQKEVSDQVDDMMNTILGRKK